MHEAAGDVHMLADVVEPQTGRIALKPVERAVGHDLYSPYLRYRNRQQQFGAALAHIARELPFFTDVARHEIELRPAGDADVLCVLRRRHFAKAYAGGIAAAVCDGEEEARRIKAICRELIGAEFS